jgi:hypothetical protein
MNDHQQVVSYVEMPDFIKGVPSAYLFDLRVLLENLRNGFFARRALPCELPDGLFDKLSAGNRLVTLHVHQAGPCLSKGIFVSSENNGNWVQESNMPHGSVGQFVDDGVLHDIHEYREVRVHRVHQCSNAFIETLNKLNQKAGRR